jgi:hypothetical protein
MILIGLATFLACNAAGGVDPNTVGVNRTYRLTQCYVSGSGFSTVPCTIYESPHQKDVRDSGWVTFRPDRTVQWMEATTTTLCSPDASGNFQCGVPTSAVNRLTGTYFLTSTSVNAVLSNPLRGPDTLVFNTSIPSSVSSNWLGPDSLRLSLFGASATYTVFTP